MNEQELYDSRYEKDLFQARDYCLETCLLSGCRPRSIFATLFFLKNNGTRIKNKRLTQVMVAKKYGVSTISLRNNLKKVKNSEYKDKIIKLLR